MKSEICQGTATRHCKNIFFEIQIRSSCSKVHLIFNYVLHRSSLILLSKCKKGENLLLFEVISLRTAEEG